MAATRLSEPRAGELGPTGRPYSAFPDPEPLVEHGPARFIAICNQKGGVGKTTTTINLGAALAEQGRRVLLVDFDPQGALSVGLGIQPHDIESTVYNLLMERDVTAHDVLYKTNVDGMDLLPSNIDLSGAEVQLVHEVGREYVLGGVLQPLMPDYDVIMIDCQPSLGLLTINALACADGVIIPLPLSHQRLADLVGAHRASVTTAMGALAARGIISRGEDGVCVLHGAPPPELHRHPPCRRHDPIRPTRRRDLVDRPPGCGADAEHPREPCVHHRDPDGVGHRERRPRGRRRRVCRGGKASTGHPDPRA